MLSVAEAAKRLGVSGARVRALLKNGQLEGRKIGNAWAITERSVVERERADNQRGRPPAKPFKRYERSLPDIDAAHRIYDEAAHVLAGCYDAAFLDQARTPEEQAFWIRVADFFLQQKQRELVEEGVF
jgi:excisionase family DNA binding protein